MILTAILIILAAICNSVMDIVSHKYFLSIFYHKRLNRNFWDATISWKNKYVNLSIHNGRRKMFWNINLHPFFTDAWHLFKSLMIIFLFLAIATCPTENIKESVAVFIGGGILYNLTFSLFYKRILIKKR